MQDNDRFIFCINVDRWGFVERIGKAEISTESFSCAMELGSCLASEHMKIGRFSQQIMMQRMIKCAHYTETFAALVGRFAES